LIDDDVIAYMRTLTDAQKAAAAAVQEPNDGRYILSLGTQAYVFSYYPSSRISAWSTYDLGFEVSDYVAMDGKVYARAGDTIYLLGGDDGETYDAAPVVVETPYIDGRAVATWKRFTGWDVVSEGEWLVEVNTDPDRPDAWSKIGTLKDGTKATVAGLDLDMVGQSPLIKFKLTNARIGPAKLSKLIIHYTPEPSN